MNAPCPSDYRKGDEALPGSPFYEDPPETGPEAAYAALDALREEVSAAADIAARAVAHEDGFTLELEAAFRKALGAIKEGLEAVEGTVDVPW